MVKYSMKEKIKKFFVKLWKFICRIFKRGLKEEIEDYKEEIDNGKSNDI